MDRRYASHAAVGALLFAAMSCNLAESLTPETTNVPLTLAREIEGTWSSKLPIPMSYQTDFCGAKQLVATATWNVTWILTPVAAFSNVLDVEMRFTQSGQTRVASNCGNGSNGWFTLPSPIFLRMTVSSSAFTAVDTNNEISVSGSYTSNAGFGNMNGTWIHYDCIAYCFGEFTAAQAFKLTRP